MPNARNALFISILFSLVLLLGAGALLASSHEGEKAVVHLTKSTNDLHAVNMALKLATALQKSGTEVTLFVDLEGVRIADVRQPLNISWGTSQPVENLYGAFVEAGGKVLVCPHCAAAAGLEAKSLRSGAKIGSEEEIVTTLTAASKILDY